MMFSHIRHVIWANYHLKFHPLVIKAQFGWVTTETSICKFSCLMIRLFQTHFIKRDNSIVWLLLHVTFYCLVCILLSGSVLIINLQCMYTSSFVLSLLLLIKFLAVKLVTIYINTLKQNKDGLLFRINWAK